MSYEVVVWNSAENGSVAQIRMPMLSKKGKMKPDWLPVIIRGDSEDDAREKAVVFYETERARLAQKEENMEAAREKAAATRKEKAK